MAAHIQSDESGGRSAPGSEKTAPIALVFTDMVGSSSAKRATSLGVSSAERDQAFIDSVQTRHLQLVRGCVSAHGGKEIMTIGDAFFLTFEETSSALLCCAEIQMRLKAQPIMTPSGRLRLRIGIHVGTPKYFENSWHGTDVDTAARAESVGAPDQIVVTTAAREAMGDTTVVKFHPLGTFTLKGLGNHSLWDADYEGSGPRKAGVPSLEEIRRQKQVKLAKNTAMATLAVGGAITGYLLLRPKHIPWVASKDKVIVAAFDNKTGEAVFDSTLEAALSLQLQQSPYVQVVSDQELKSDLKKIGQSSDTVITPLVADKIGRHEGIKAYVTGAVEKTSTGYVVTLNAIDCATNQLFAGEQEHAAEKPQVLTALATSASKLRAKLGESLGSIRQFTSPYKDVTTASLEAFHAYSLGKDQELKGHDLPEAALFYKQAIGIDPGFSKAYQQLGILYCNSGETSLGIGYLQKALDLLQSGSETERLRINGLIASYQGDIPNAIADYKAYAAIYPRSESAWNNLGLSYYQFGEFDKAIEAFTKSYDISKLDSSSAINMASVFVQMDRFPEAKEYLERASNSLGVADTNTISTMSLREFLIGNGEWKKLITQAAERPDNFTLYITASVVEYYEGHTADARVDVARASRYSIAAKLPQVTNNIFASAALNEALNGECRQSNIWSRRSLDRDVTLNSPEAPLALALCGEAALALSDVDQIAQANPKDTMIQMVIRPEVKAAIALAAHRPEEVEGILASAEPYAAVSIVPYLEGMAFLQQRKPQEAIKALTPALRWRGLNMVQGYPLYGIALLLTARAQLMAGDQDASRKTYQQALDIWGTADHDFKLALEAKRELAAIR